MAVSDKSSSTMEKESMSTMEKEAVSIKTISIERGSRDIQLLIHNHHSYDFISVPSSDTVVSLKKLLQKKIRLPPNKQLLFHHHDLPPLEDDKTFDDYQSLKLFHIWVLTPSVELVVKIPQANSSFFFRVYESNTISDVKQMISEKMGVPANRQALFHDGQLLSDDDTSLYLYDIPRNCVLFAFFGLDRGEDEMELNVTTIDDDDENTEFVIKVKPRYTVLHMKAVIESKADIPIEIQDLGEELKDWKTVKDCKLKDGSSLPLKTVGSPMMIFVRTNSPGDEESVIPIEAKSNNTIGWILEEIPKKKLERIGGQPGLFLDGKWLTEKKSIAYYDIKSGSRLSLERVVEINVVIMNGENVKVVVKASESIYDLEVRIEEMCGIPEDLQSLTYLEKELDDWTTLEECEDLFGSLWALRWNWGGKSYSFFWPTYLVD